MAGVRVSKKEAESRIDYILEQLQRAASVGAALRHYLFCGVAMFLWVQTILGGLELAVLSIPYAVFLLLGYQYVKNGVKRADEVELVRLKTELRDLDASFPGLKAEVWTRYQGLNQFIVQQSLERTAWAIAVVVPAVSLVAGALLYWTLR